MNLFLTRLQNFAEGFVPSRARSDIDVLRHCRLMIGFGFLGGVFGLVYASFYLSIGHYYGAAIIVVCNAAFLSVPWLLKHTHRAISFYGHFLCAVLTIGFSALAAIEGGVRGHAVAWLATVPLCAVLLISARASYVWFGVGTLAAVLFSAADLHAPDMLMLYPRKWHAWITLAGFVGLPIFLFFLALIFERGRTAALAKMLQAHKELQRANEELALANQRLVDLDKEKNEFIGIAAHDLKNPLVGVLGFAEILAMQPKPTHAENQMFGERIKGAAERMLHLITNLLDINAMEQGRLGVNIVEVDLGGVITQAIAAHQLSALRKNITIHFSLPRTTYVIADSSATLQVIENFISNAVKYSPPGSNVRVNVSVQQGETLIEIQDEGPGLSEEDQAKLFQKFSRLTPQPTGGESSNGLGLSIVKRLAESMGGRVGCRSELGKGTVFWVALKGYFAVVAA